MCEANASTTRGAHRGPFLVFIAQGGGGSLSRVVTIILECLLCVKYNYLIDYFIIKILYEYFEHRFILRKIKIRNVI